ncbi:type II secretion system F family protein [Thiomicrorhabdus sp. ZW0627]|uniref:type II secretion system F family protein n=1 Tax=Thiomicrorhabdus sp. ZW0627 TaxID=3039774 RepID=UPI0024364EB5|nr:type II secretion system F family protein [Thiomicrorhabdus sp. ZW0627]MDG6774902.1 type II secretion system F family protein [Thiomicrorhabdus sp. ZW0627]
MDFGFVIVALAICFPFFVFGFGVTIKRQQQRRNELRALLVRAGINQLEQKTIQDQLMQQKQKPWFIWLSGKFKKAGMARKNDVIRLVVIQALLLFVSAFLIATRFNDLNEKTIVLSVLLPLLPVIYLQLKIHQRQKELRNQFPDMLDSIVRSLHSGYGIDGAIAAIGEDMKGPLAQELKEVSKQLTLGISMRDILREFQRRVDLPEAQFFVITLIIQRETGGQLSSILTELSRLMRRREKFQAKLKTLTAESRFTAWFIGGAPVAYIAYKYFFDPESMDFFLNDPLGYKLFWGSVILIFMGTMILRHMLKMRF